MLRNPKEKRLALSPLSRPNENQSSGKLVENFLLNFVINGRNFIGMRFLSLFPALLSFIIGVVIVSTIESRINGIDLGETPTVNEPFRLDRDAYIAKYTISKKIDFRVNGIGVKSTEKEVRNRLGRAKKVDLDTVNYESGTEGFKDFYFDGLFIGTKSNESGEFSVDIIEIDSGRWSFSGVGIGSSVSDVKREFGEPFRVDEYKLYYNPPQTGALLEFEINNGHVVKIKTGFGRC